MKIKKGDTVLVISGKDRNRKGKILKTFPKEKKVVVENINLMKKHQKARGQEKGQIIKKPAKIDVSNVALICSKCKKATRVGYKVGKNQKSRICKKCGKKI